LHCGYFPSDNIILLSEDDVDLDQVAADFDAEMAKYDSAVKEVELIQKQQADAEIAEAENRNKSQKGALAAVKAAAKLERKTRKATKAKREEKTFMEVELEEFLAAAKAVLQSYNSG
jgi:hypothetical protein